MLNQCHKLPIEIDIFIICFHARVERKRVTLDMLLLLSVVCSNRFCYYSLMHLLVLHTRDTRNNRKVRKKTRRQGGGSHNHWLPKCKKGKYNCATLIFAWPERIHILSIYSFVLCILLLFMLYIPIYYYHY